MSMTGTPTQFLGLNQWLSSDKPVREEFNEDNRKLETAITTHTHTGNGDGTKIDYEDIIGTPASMPANGGHATTADRLETPHTINGVAFDGSANITIKAEAVSGFADTAAYAAGAGTADTANTAISATYTANRTLEAFVLRNTYVASWGPPDSTVGENGDIWLQYQIQQEV